MFTEWVFAKKCDKKMNTKPMKVSKITNVGAHIPFFLGNLNKVYCAAEVAL